MKRSKFSSQLLSRPPSFGEAGLCLFLLLLAILVGSPAVCQQTNVSRPRQNLVDDLVVPPFSESTSAAPFVLPPLDQQTTGPETVSSDPRFVLRAVRFIGNTAFDDEQLGHVARPFLDRQVSSGDLEALRLQLSTFYISHGYINSGAVLPDQSINNGTVRYRIKEGRLSDIKVSGSGRLRPAYVSRRLNPEEDHVLNAEVLQQRFQLLLADPLIDRINGELRPGELPGEALLDLEVIRSRPYSLQLSFDNYHPPSSGSYEANLDGSLHNLTGFGDKLFIHGEKSDGAWDITGMFAIPLNRYDTRAFFRWENGDSTVIEESLKVLDIESDYRSFEFGASHPFYRTVNREFIGGISLSHRQSQTWMLGDTFPFSPGVERDGSAKTSVLRLTQEFSDRTVDRVIALRSTFGIGLSFLDATVHEDEPDSQFAAWIGQARYARKYRALDSQLLLRTDMQFATDSLLPMERFALGGRYSVRGYRENELVRDNGFSATAEFRYNLIGNVDNKHDLSIQLAPFIDTGSGWNKNEFEDAELLLSAGVGIILKWNTFFAECYAAYAFNEPAEKVAYDLQDSGIHFRLSWKPL